MAQDQCGVDVGPVDVQNVTFHWEKALVFQIWTVLFVCALRTEDGTRLIPRKNRHRWRSVITYILCIF